MEILSIIQIKEFKNIVKKNLKIVIYHLGQTLRLFVSQSNIIILETFSRMKKS